MQNSSQNTGKFSRSRTRNPAHGLSVYRNLAWTARIPSDRSRHPAPRVGLTSWTTRLLPRLSPLSGVLFTDQRGPRAMSTRFAHAGSPGHVAPASPTVWMRRLPSSALGKKWDLRRPCQVDGAALPSSAPRIPARLPVQRTGASLWPLGPHRVSLDVWKEPRCTAKKTGASFRDWWILKT